MAHSRLQTQTRSMSEMGQSRLNQPVLPTIRCLLCTESDLIVALMRNDAKGHERTRAQIAFLLDQLVGAPD
jgi:hypothetical protein